MIGFILHCFNSLLWFPIITRIYEPDCRDLPPFSHRGINEVTLMLAAQVWLTAGTSVVG